MESAAPKIRSTAPLAGEHGWFRGRRRVYVELVRAALGEVLLTRALDIGAGGGGFVRALAELAQHVERVDLEPAALAPDARLELPAGVAADARQLPFRARSFDLVTLFDVLEHIDDERRVLAEARRALRPGGVIALTVPAYGWLDSLGAGSVRRYSRSSLRRALVRSGFQVERITHTNVALFPALAPTVLALELIERLRLVPRHVRHLRSAVPMPRWLSSVLGHMFAAELALSSRFDLPIGHSILAIARRPTAERRRRRPVRVETPARSVEHVRGVAERVRGLAERARGVAAPEPAAVLPSAAENERATPTRASRTEISAPRPES